MSKGRIAKFIGEGFFVLIAVAIVVANAIERNWLWFGIWLAIVAIWLVQLIANVTLALVDPGERS